ncbi:putative ABC transport system ATP-binding protein [Ilumatobacter fluminis]|uniref:Putative ABC transport system ATP-binding protein n=1 Tax=Ilumatobacter fluminis TaxID=467091 RepID=A0A4R7I1T8_9ACTN|nr:ABC transporter ATP-binding protein [Ilumatobacter fluminis]TDT17150.1 putative ABC transport system ATP-binding protein [Ilumatobacter fluminis]
MSIELDDIVVTVPDGDQTRTLLDHASLVIGRGEVVALSGPSGSGKSTLLAVAALLLRADRGTVRIDGVDAHAANDRDRTLLRQQHIGVVYQNANLFPSLTARQQVELVAHVRGELDHHARERAADLLRTVGLDSRLDARPAELSGGERQRVNIARALMGRPSVIVADEPTASLDASRGEQIMKLLVDRARESGVATLVVTHLPEQVAATRHVTIEHGGLVERDWSDAA